MKAILKSPGTIFLLFAIILAGCTKENITNILYGPAPTVDAGAPQTIQLPTNSVTITGTVTSNKSKIVGYLWSQVSGPNVPEIESESSPGTDINNLIEGTYKFQFMAIDSAGLTGVDTLSVIVKPAPIQNLTLQPTNNTTEVAFISVFSATDKNAPEFNAAAWTWQGTPGTIRSAFKFDFSGIPANATILSAKLTLYSSPTPINGNGTSNYGSNNAFYIRRINSSWDVNTATWSTQPTTETTNQVLVAHTAQSSLDLADVDVTGLVSRMHTISNNGFMISLQNETYYNIRTFASSKYTDAAKHPKLVITYQ